MDACLGVMNQSTKRKRVSKRAVRGVTPRRVRTFVEGVIGEDLHAKRVLSVSNGVVGVVHAAALSIHAIGQGLAAASGSNPKHAVKQVDRLLSNSGVDVGSLFEPWVRYVVGSRKELVVALDWTEFDGDGQSTIALHAITSHGRSTPLVWKTVRKASLRGHRNRYEDEVIDRLHCILPPEIRLTLLADRGFGDQKRYEHLAGLGWDYVIRFRGIIGVEDSKGIAQTARQWLAPNGRAKMLRNVRVTGERVAIPGFVSVQAKGMKEAWFLATSHRELRATEVVKLYGKRFRIEENFRDTKDIRFGMGLSSTHIGEPKRRDRLLLLSAFAHALMTLLGAAAESVGLDRMLKVNTSKKRSHSLYRQGCYWYSAIPNMPRERLRTLMAAYAAIVAEHAVFRDIFGII